MYDYLLQKGSEPDSAKNQTALYRVRIKDLLIAAPTLEKVFSHPRLLSGRGIVVHDKLIQVLMGGDLLLYDFSLQKEIFRTSIRESDRDWLLSSPVILGDRLDIANSAFKSGWFHQSLHCFELLPE